MRRKLFKNWKPQDFLFLFLFLFSPLYYHNNIGGTGFDIPNNITVWLSATMVIFYGTLTCIQKSTIVVSRYLLFLFVFPATIILRSLIWGGDDLTVLVIRLFYLLGGIIFIWSMLQFRLNSEQIDKLFFIIVLSALLQGVAGGGQLYLPDFIPALNRENLPTGTFQQINNQAVFQVISILLAIKLLSKDFYYKSMKKRLLLLLSITVSFFVLSLSGSRIGFFSLLIAIPIMLYACYQDYRLNRRGVLNLMLALSLGIAIAATHNIFNKHSDNKLIEKTISLNKDYSQDERVGIYTLSASLIRERLVEGYGIGQFGYYFQSKRPDFYQSHEELSLPNKYVAHPHNEVLMWAFEGGAITVLGLISMTFVIGIALFKCGRQKGLFFFSLLLPFALHMQVELPFYTSSLLFFTFLCVLYPLFTISESIVTFNLGQFTRRSLIYLTITVTASGFAFFIHSMKANKEISEFFNARSLNFNYSRINPLFKDHVDWLLHRTFAFALIESNKKEGIEELIDWYVEKLAYRPDPLLYGDIIQLYELGDMNDKACEYASKALSVYPKLSSIKKYSSTNCH